MIQQTLTATSFLAHTYCVNSIINIKNDFDQNQLLMKNKQKLRVAVFKLPKCL